VGSEDAKNFSDAIPMFFDRALDGFLQESFQFGEGLLDQIQV
jgi:hypothetical protein